MPFALTDDEKKFLLILARSAIFDFLHGRKPEQEEYYTETLKQKTGAFVTLTRDQDLRGCIGYVDAILPLQDTIREMAISAAFNDPRFQPVENDELRHIEIEISVLTPKETVRDISEIRIGRDGLIIKKGFREGLLLPQVATEYKWDVETFLSQTCRKAGLPAGAWKESGTEIKRFSALIFSEHEFNLH